MPIGYEPSYDSSGGQQVTEDSVIVPSESEMITRDFNFVNVDFYIEYQIVDPIRAYVNSENNITILKNLAQSYIRDTVGSYGVDEVITTGKSEIQARVKTLLSERLEKEDIGLGIYNVTIQDAEPPTEAVLAAFKEVETAKQNKETEVNNANKYRSEQIPAAEAQADQIVQQAEADKQSRINEATGQVARFNAMYEEYQKFPGITKQRMYYEAMEELLPGLKVILTDGNGNHLNLFDFGG